MFQQILRSFGMAIQSIRSRLWHTLLSVLGIIIGVAALVATLSLIDGMEKYANDQINKTTSLKAIMVSTNSYTSKNGVRVRNDSVPFIDYQAHQKLSAAIPFVHKTYLRAQKNKSVKIKGETESLAAVTHYQSEQFRAINSPLLHGRYFTTADVETQANHIIINEAFAKLVDSVNVENTLRKQIVIDSIELEVIGVVGNDNDTRPSVFVPLSHLAKAELKKSPPQLVLEASDVAEVDTIKSLTEAWIKTTFPDQHENFKVMSYGKRVEQAAQGFLIFRIIMGMIVGLSVLVGGIGVMNVLLISVSERTKEIGIRKAIGASKSAITTQFLSESVAVSIFGSTIGVIVGMGFASLAMPILKLFVEDIPFGVSFTLNTLLVIGIIAIVIGIIFGTYPAMKAARLDPVSAIQRE